MNPQEMKAELGALGALVEARLATIFGDGLTPGLLAASMDYSLMAGGKRLRPVLCLAWAELVGGRADQVLDFACAIECIHTYSLIHDDLPAMDDDDLRRGKPSNHKKFDEATAILAGDGLLTEAFTLASSVALQPDRILKAIFHLSTAAGPRGMVGGQVLDMGLTGKSASLSQLREMHAKKTGALIESSCVTGCILGGGGDPEQALASEYGRAIGLAFQVTDDILDVVGDEAALGKPVGSDEAQGKSTYPALLGIDQSRVLARQSVDQALAALSEFSHPRADFLRAVALYILDRTH
ncbi:MAG: polyprenyl synthetase [Deltaproteobacteria bacterium HGW-Deltaproteobacteria-18]|jgi:geranylgeranyl diphosphate synthase type II|nr:MAG: polyprenyl synthetase [Deltaproteobacteria bacterium HGW-Deltaproteobacteria-18]